jgi:hypothetical protein
MKAIFVHRDTLLRDSNLIAPPDPTQASLAPSTLEAVRNLGGGDTLLFLYAGCDAPAGEASAPPALGVLARQVEAAGGRIDGLITCPHAAGSGCGCWGSEAKALWGAASQFGLRLNECYVIGDSGADVAMAYGTGARPIMVLNGRTLGEVLGRLPDHKGFPVATDLSMAAGYVGVEEDITHQLGHPRAAALAQPEDILFGPAEDLPAVAVISPLARNLQVQLNRSRAQLRDVARWLSFFVLGALGLTLGIAYMMTHLYRVQPFPEYVYYLTLQFISRPLRGALFIVLGLLIIVVAARSYYRSSSFRLPRKRAD